MKNFILIVIPLLLFSCASNKKQKEVTAKKPAMVEKNVMMDEPDLMMESQMMSGPKMGSYKVRRNDTLMWISFKLYGDYAKWRDLLKQNPALARRRLEVGETIVYVEPDKRFVWNKNGSPYYIVRGDTLGKISQKLYSTNQKWRNLWKNNRQMIKDPNLIFAGFILYYQMEKELALVNGSKK